jgi:hypothetical protein
VAAGPLQDAPRTASPHTDTGLAFPAVGSQASLQAGLSSIFRGEARAVAGRSPRAPRHPASLVKSRSRTSLFEDDRADSVDDFEVYHTITGGKTNQIAASRQPVPFARITRRPARLAARMAVMRAASRPEDGDSVLGEEVGQEPGPGRAEGPTTHLSVPLIQGQHAASRVMQCRRPA